MLVELKSFSLIGLNSQAVKGFWPCLELLLRTMWWAASVYTYCCSSPRLDGVGLLYIHRL